MSVFFYVNLEFDSNFTETKKFKGTFRENYSAQRR